jgi:hypothetical protein
MTRILVIDTDTPRNMRDYPDIACHRCDRCRVRILAVTPTAEDRRLVHCSCPNCGDTWHWLLSETADTEGQW